MPSAALLEADGPNLTTREVGALGSMTRLAAMLFAWALALGCAQANAQAGATPPTPELSEGPQSIEPDASQTSLAHPPTVDDICRALEQAAARERSSSRVFRTGHLAGMSATLMNDSMRRDSSPNYRDVTKRRPG